jgi:thiaminase/transcriptional activator TenA
MAKLADQLLEENMELLDTIYNHPFLNDLEEGTLPISKYRFYVKQNILYLNEFSRNLAILSTRIKDDPKAAAAFLNMSYRVRTEEMERQEEFAKCIGIRPEELNSTIPLAVPTLAYTSFEYRMCNFESLPVAAAALAPCQWIYGEIGPKFISGLKKSYNLTDKDLIMYEYYSSKPYMELSRMVADFINRTIEQALHVEYDKKWVHIAFRTSCEFEYLFFDVPYRHKD